MVGGRRELRALALWLALGAGAGAAAGVLFGGIGGRIVMLILRERSPDAVGLTSDDGFEIGQVTVASLNLLLFGAFAGALFGVLYLVARLGVPPVARVPVAALLGATVGGAAFIVPDGIDLLVLEPLWFAVASFIALPALSALTTAVVIERRAGRLPHLAARLTTARPALALAGRVAIGAVVVILVVTQGLTLADDVARVL